jgi:hypothetical protein
MAKESRPLNPYDPDDRYCYYCHKQYASMGTFKRHVVAKHGIGMGAMLGLLSPEEEAERQRAMAERGESDDPWMAARRHPYYKAPS